MKTHKKPLSLEHMRSVTAYFAAETYEAGPARVEYERLLARHDEIDGELGNLLTRILEAPAWSAEGMRVKAMVALWYSENPRPFADQVWFGPFDAGLDIREEAAASILRDLARIFDLSDYAKQLLAVRT